MSYSIKQTSDITKISETILRSYIKKFPLLFSGKKKKKYARISLSDKDIEILLKINTLYKTNNKNEIENIILKKSEDISVKKVESAIVKDNLKNNLEPKISGLITTIKKLESNLKDQNLVIDDLSKKNNIIISQNKTLIKKLELLENINKKINEKKKDNTPLLKIISDRFFSWFFE